MWKFKTTENLKILDKKMEMDTNVTFSENQPWEHQIWEFRKVDNVPLRLYILPKIVLISATNSCKGNQDIG